MVEGTSIEAINVVPFLGKKVVIVGGVLSTNETLTVEGITELDGVILINKADNLTDTATVSGNVITLTQATITDQTYTGIAWGTG